MPKVSDEHQESRRMQILGAAMQCFAQKGYHKTTMQDICRQAGLSAGAVYNYFKGKDEIIEAAAAMGQMQAREIFSAAGALESQGVPAILMAALEGYRQLLHMEGVHTGLRADVMFHAEALTNDKLADIGLASYRNIMDQLLLLTERWQACGGIAKELSSQAVAQVLFAMVQGLMTQLVMNPAIDVDAYFQALEAIMFGEKSG